VSDVFISYANEDQGRVEPLVDELQRHHWDVWWDRCIPPGLTWDQVIEKALKEARCVIVLWSKSSVQSHWVKTEAEEARQRNILIPVLLDSDVTIPLAFRFLQAANLADTFGGFSGAEFEKLTSAVARVLSECVPPITKTEAQSTRTAPEMGVSPFQPSSPRFLYRGHAAGLSGLIEQPGKYVIAVQAASVVPVSGGHDSARVEAMAWEAPPRGNRKRASPRPSLWFEVAHSEATGMYNSATDAQEISVRATIEGFKLSDMVRVDVATGWVTAVQTAEESSQPRITLRSSAFQGVWIANREIELESRIEDYGKLSTMDRLRDCYRNDPHFREQFDSDCFVGQSDVLSENIRSYFPWHRWARSDHLPEHRGQTIVPLFVVKNDSAPGFDVHRNVVHVQGFGTVQLGTLVIGQDSRSITMIHVDCTVPTKGHFSACSVDGGFGGPWLPA